MTVPVVPRVRIVLPAALRRYWEADASELLVQGETLAAAVAELGARHAGLAARIVDEQGRVRRHVLLFVNDASVAHLDPSSVPLRDGDVVRVLPAVSGGD